MFGNVQQFGEKSELVAFYVCFAGETADVERGLIGAEGSEGLSGLEGVGETLLLKSASEGIETDRRLVAAGWDLGDLTRRYRRFVDTFTPVADAMPCGTNESAFIVRTLLIHEYRKIHLQDPLLPPALLPADWVGATAYELTQRLYRAVFTAAEDYLSNTASTTTEPLPPADRSAYARFGGLDRARD